MQPETAFLADSLARPWTPPVAFGWDHGALHVGHGDHAIEVVAARSAAVPTAGNLLQGWKVRRAGRAAPVLVVVRHPEGAALCGAAGTEPPVYLAVDAGQAERICQEVLNAPDRHAALRFLAQVLPSLETALPGISNEGLLALHELRHGTPCRTDWNEAGRKAARTLDHQDDDLLRSLGFQVERIDNLTSLLRSGDRKVAVAVMLRETEAPEGGTARFNNLSPVSYALAKADAEHLPWVIVGQRKRLRLYSTEVNAGVGRRGRTETYIECQPTLLSDDDLAYLWLIYSADALVPGGSLGELLESSHRFAGDLAERLRERIYDIVVPLLAQGIADARNLTDPGPAELQRTYEMALTVLFRLLFIAYAEDRDLLPYRLNDAYRRRSLKQKAQELAECIREGTPVAAGSNHWQETVLLCQAVEAGNAQWAVPAYDGGLFSDQREVSPAGLELAGITLPNSVFEEALRALLVIDTAEGVPGPVDFRSLGVREFGTIYEGLLESELALATTDLTLNRKGAYEPAGKKGAVTVRRGGIYLHNRSGARKASGSYYTKPFAVEHLLDGALDPGLEDHFARLDELDDVDAAERFFDFRVADLAMGSGHFLITAIDRIEKDMADYLARRNLPGVRGELAALREAAILELGELAETTAIEDGQLLRRLIARRCIYGVDLNGLSVQLARLAVWIHTFVPGLPLSVLDRQLVQGNALVGIGSIRDIRSRLHEATGPLFPIDVERLLGQAAQPLNRLARLNDATMQDVVAAREAIHEVAAALRNTSALCDLITAKPIASDVSVASYPFEDWEDLPDDLEESDEAVAAHRELETVHALHFPVAFPEVFLREHPGFDVIVGNPPWQEATVEEDAFWARHSPGLRALPQRQQEAEKGRLRSARPDLTALFEAEKAEMELVRKALVSGAYPGMGTGDPDLYKAFCWRFWHLAAADRGRVGVVLPRSALAAKGSTPFRKEVFGNAATVSIDMLLNSGGWVFDEAEHRYTIGLVCLVRGTPSERSIGLRGPFASMQAFAAGSRRALSTFSRDNVLGWNDSASLPLLPTEASVDVFAQMRRAPRLDRNVDGEWRARPDAELHATTQKPLMDLVSATCPDGYWPVYKGESFDLWTPDTGVYYAFADPKPVQDWLLRKRVRVGRSKADGAHREFSLKHLQNRATLPCFAPRVAFRDVSRATDTRTIRVALLPPNVFVTNKGPYFLWPRGDERDQAFLLGVLASIPLDWYARRFVEVSVNYFIINPFPVPRPERDDMRWQRVVELAGRLACPADRFAGWASAVGVETGPLADDDKQDMIHELDAVVAHLYGLTEAQLRHIFETFHAGWDYHHRLDGVVRHFRDWATR